MACDPGIIVSVFVVVYLSCTQQKDDDDDDDDDDDSAFRTAEFPFVESVELLGTCYRDRTFYYSRADYCCCGRQLRLLVQYFALFPFSLFFPRRFVFFNESGFLRETGWKDEKEWYFWNIGDLETIVLFNYFRDLYILCIFFSYNSKSTSLFLFSSRGDLYFSVRVDFLKEVEKNVKMMFILKRKKNRYICVSSVKEIIWLEIIYLH